MSQQFTNRLIKENSLYLLQHAHNPVDWHSWGNEALEKAKLENKMILVSIGYAACHWCHVMERESFENEKVAAKMNTYFINIKIDREERPDLDHIYMDAVQAMTGSGGWPLNVFLTPEAKPFYGGTYFPPSRAFNRSSWEEVLDAMIAAWKDKKGAIELQADSLLEHLQKAGDFSSIKQSDTAFSKELCSQIAENILKQADKEWGGFGTAPKFPQTFTIQYLLENYYFTGNSEALQHALLSLDKMIQGGIYDQAGGGFSRYSTDNEWVAPHFEKMLYDNALLISVISNACQITKNTEYERVIRETIKFIKRELLNREGGFYAALDADSEGEEGRFYVWDKETVEQILGVDAALFCAFYKVTNEGNWEGKNILHIVKKTNIFAAERGLTSSTVEKTLQQCLAKLLFERNKRVRPLTDDKILLGWNALMVTALCKAGAALNEDSYKLLAEKSLQFLFKNFKKNVQEAGFWHTYKNGEAKYPAFLDDYACLIEACIHMQEITSSLQYLNWASEITQFVMDNFKDEATGFFYYTHKDQADIIVRKKELHDGALPSGNSTMAGNLLYLSVVFNNPVWLQTAERMVRSMSTAIVNYPASFGVWASLLQQITFGTDELVITGNDFKAYRNQLLTVYWPARILQSAIEEHADFPLLRDKSYGGKETLIYRCVQYSCKTPVNSIEKILDQRAMEGKFRAYPQ
jgi:uncharacterized protein